MLSTGSISLSTPADVVALTPYLLRFHPPRNSLVVIAGDAAGRSVALRWDLTRDRQHEEIVWQLYSVLIRQRIEWVFLLGYGSVQVTTQLLEVVQDALESILTVKDVLRVDDGRWWSLMCKADCCPPEGTPIDRASTVVAAQATYAGLAVYGSRDEVAESIAPVQGQDLLWMQAETERAHAELYSAGWRSRRKSRDRMATARRLIGQPRRLTDRQAAHLSVLLTHPRVRDAAVALLVKRGTDRQLELWRDLTRRAVGRYAAGPAALLAAAALLRGDGVLASVALERCRAADPSHQLIGLIEDLLDMSASPEQLRARLSAPTRPGRRSHE